MQNRGLALMVYEEATLTVCYASAGLSSSRAAAPYCNLAEARRFAVPDVGPAGLPQEAGQPALDRSVSTRWWFLATQAGRDIGVSLYLSAR
jgi:hypothetical protein